MKLSFVSVVAIASLGLGIPAHAQDITSTSLDVPCAATQMGQIATVRCRNAGDLFIIGVNLPQGTTTGTPLSCTVVETRVGARWPEGCKRSKPVKLTASNQRK